MKKEFGFDLFSQVSHVKKEFGFRLFSQVSHVKKEFGFDRVPPVIPAATGAADARFSRSHTINIPQNIVYQTWGPSKWRLGLEFQMDSGVLIREMYNILAAEGYEWSTITAWRFLARKAPPPPSPSWDAGHSAEGKHGSVGSTSSTRPEHGSADGKNYTSGGSSGSDSNADRERPSDYANKNSPGGDGTKSADRGSVGKRSGSTPGGGTSGSTTVPATGSSKSATEDDPNLIFHSVNSVRAAEIRWTGERAAEPVDRGKLPTKHGDRAGGVKSDERGFATPPRGQTSTSCSEGGATTPQDSSTQEIKQDVLHSTPPDSTILVVNIYKMNTML